MKPAQALPLALLGVQPRRMEFWRGEPQMDSRQRHLLIWAEPVWGSGGPRHPRLHLAPDRNLPPWCLGGDQYAFPISSRGPAGFDQCALRDRFQRDQVNREHRKHGSYFGSNDLLLVLGAEH